MLLGKTTFSSCIVLASAVLFFAACGDGTETPSAPTGGAVNMPNAGTVTGGGTSGAATVTGGASAVNAGASSGFAGTTQTGGQATSSAGAGQAGTGGAAGGSAGNTSNGGAAGSNTAGSAGAGGAATFQPCPENAPCKVMPFGDSITQGYNVAGGYRAPLFHLALAAKHDITFVGSASDYSVPTVDGVAFPKNHEGHGGYTIEGNNGIAQFVGTSIPSYKPNIITLMIGTNDINGNNDVANAPSRLGKLLDSIYMRAPNALVVLAQIVPTRTDGTNKAVQTYNAAMPGLVATRIGMGQHLVLVDMYAAFTKDPNYKQSLFGDNLHPNQTGYNLMADVWFQALSPYLR